MSHLWKSLGQKRTIAIKYEPSPVLLKYLSDMRDATRMALAYALVDAKLNDGKIPNPIRLRKKIKPWFVSTMPYARHHINPVCSKAVALLRSYRKKHRKLALPTLDKLSMRIDGELFRKTEEDGKVTIRITLKPNVYERVRFIPTHKKWAAYSSGRLGEVTLTGEKLCLTFIDGLAAKPIGTEQTAVDLNFATIDYTTTTADGIKEVRTFDAGRIEHIQKSFQRRRRRLQLHIRNPQKRESKLLETRGRQRNRIKDALHKMTAEFVRTHPTASPVFEDLKNIRSGGRKKVHHRKSLRFRTRLNRWPYRMAQSMMEYKSPMQALYVLPRGTSSRCPVCGGKLEHPTWKVSRCRTCAVDYDRNRLASLAIACRGRRLCGQPFPVSAMASWPLWRSEYLSNGVVPNSAMADRTEQGVNASIKVMS